MGFLLIFFFVNLGKFQETYPMLANGLETCSPKSLKASIFLTSNKCQSPMQQWIFSVTLEFQVKTSLEPHNT